MIWEEGVLYSAEAFVLWLKTTEQLALFIGIEQLLEYLKIGNDYLITCHYFN